jgi:phage baseplate assembly protein W
MGQKFIGVVLPMRLGNTGMFDQSTQVIQQVRSNFKNLILTKKGERVGQYELGCDLWKILFEPFTEETLETARVAVVDAVDRWLPFLELVDFDATTTNDKHIINIICLYRFRNNPNVVDQVTISSSELGLPTVGVTQEPTSDEGISTFAADTNNTRIKRKEAVRLRRI